MSNTRLLFVVSASVFVGVLPAQGWADKSGNNQDLTPYMIQTPPPIGIKVEPVAPVPKKGLAPINANVPKPQPEFIENTKIQTKANLVKPGSSAGIDRNLPIDSSLPASSPEPLVRPDGARQSIGKQHSDMLRDSRQVRQLREIKQMNELLPKETLKGYVVDPMHKPGDTGGRPPIGSLPGESGPGGPERAFTDPYTARRGDPGKPGMMVGPSGGDLKSITKGANKGQAEGGWLARIPGSTWQGERNTSTGHQHYFNADGSVSIKNMSTGEVNTLPVTSEQLNRDENGNVVNGTIVSELGDRRVTHSWTVGTNGSQSHVFTQEDKRTGAITSHEEIYLPPASKGGDPKEQPGVDDSNAKANVCATMPWLQECRANDRNPNPGANPGTAGNTGQPVGVRLKVETDDLLVNPSPTDIQAQGQPKYTAPGQIGVGPGAKPLPPGDGDLPGKN